MKRWGWLRSELALQQIYKPDFNYILLTSKNNSKQSIQLIHKPNFHNILLISEFRAIILLTGTAPAKLGHMVGLPLHVISDRFATIDELASLDWKTKSSVARLCCRQFFLKLWCLMHCWVLNYCLHYNFIENKRNNASTWCYGYWPRIWKALALFIITLIFMVTFNLLIWESLIDLLKKKQKKKKTIKALITILTDLLSLLLKAREAFLFLYVKRVFRHIFISLHLAELFKFAFGVN